MPTGVSHTRSPCWSLVGFENRKSRYVVDKRAHRRRRAWIKHKAMATMACWEFPTASFTYLRKVLACRGVGGGGEVRNSDALAGKKTRP